MKLPICRFQIAIDSFFLWCCLYIGKHFQLLAKSFDGDKKKFVRRHQSILDVAEDLRDLIKPILFIQFMTCSLMFCVDMFTALQSDDLFKQFSVIAIVFGQQLEYCIGGQYLTDRSMEVGEEFYSSDKDNLMIVARAQKKFSIRAYLYQADLEFVAFMLNSAFSLLTVLRNFV